VSVLNSLLASLVDHAILDWFTLQCIRSCLDLADCAKTKHFHVWRPDELLVVPWIDQFVLDLTNRTLHVAD